MIMQKDLPHLHIKSFSQQVFYALLNIFRWNLQSRKWLHDIEKLTKSNQSDYETCISITIFNDYLSINVSNMSFSHQFCLTIRYTRYLVNELILIECVPNVTNRSQ